MSRQETAAAHPLSSEPSSTNIIRIVIADSRPIFRDGLRHLLETESRLRIVGEAIPGSAAARLARECSADVLLLDFQGASAFETLRDLADGGAAVRTILLVASVDDPDLTEVLQLGARGLVVKDAAAETLFESIQSVMAGHYWIATSGVADAAASLRSLEAERRRRRAFGLTKRELDIVRMVVAGYTNKEMAAKLSIGENTVKSHLTHIFNKLGASSRVELGVFAAHHRLLDTT